MKDNKKLGFLFCIVYTISFFFALESVGHPETLKKYSWEVEGVLWAAQIESLESFDSEIAMEWKP